MLLVDLRGSPARTPGHAGYWDDPRMSVLVNKAAAETLTTAGAETPRLQGLHPDGGALLR